MRHIRGVARAVAATVVIGTSLTAGTAHAAQADENYAALGDSFASGTGTRDYFEDSGDCLRSPKAYPQLWADAHGAATFSFDACSGATTDDLNADQLGSLSADTTLVTVQIGGNDIGFADVIQGCLLGTDENCDSAVGDGEAATRDELPAKLDATYEGIRAAAPNAEIVVVGYPRINSTGDCGIPGFTETKRERINKGADVLAEVISERAEAAGFTYADPRSAFDGHGVCGDPEWINGPSTPLQESFHPNVTGHAEGYLPVVESAIG
ncbi:MULTISPECIES: SGNH/GDSL hydrolase family protein [Saccharopolyspora]|uniref:SGNH family lipase n=1 Tax=Saccharopolyspora gregorii TaxID=33914 RepID=A0ABP6RS92_9PSEU|nr:MULTISPECIES: SGNH/GDSL hydrolase family protein [Saccharopolyspora]MCA1188117.1 SGNH/GDSL hydrolase family protein [Saccharopolyspora sp. 6T]MCA1193407.1 SGNH/GDSL hydrolase family protein [Saccharopolyspora sp. 6V]MCA1226901.1 SGNH/GDSL hydrolase family protein [Saccharopolyspora sp. 6M]MCA1280640.1 SGNH/GDSL hydrolase family protein [Saccharopolyspora sp. 7B]